MDIKRLACIDAGYTLPGLVIFDTGGFVSPSSWKILLAETLITERADDRDYVATDDARRISEISLWMAEAMREFKVTHAVVELPSSGARSAAAHKGMGMAAAQVATLLTTLSIVPHYFIPSQTKKVCAGDKDAEKIEMIAAAKRVWPDFQWPLKIRRGKLTRDIDMKKAEAIADAMCAGITYANLKLSAVPIGNNVLGAN